MAKLQHRRLCRIEEQVRAVTQIELGFVGIDVHGCIVDDGRPLIAPWLGKHHSLAPGPLKLILTGAGSGERVLDLTRI